MIFLLPAIESNCCRAFPSSPQKWTRLEKAGLALDIFIAASLCLTAGLAVCAHSGISLGPLNAFSVIDPSMMIVLASTATLTLLGDIIKTIQKPQKISSDHPPAENPPKPYFLSNIYRGVKEKSVSFIKSRFKPGNIQMRFYELQNAFLVEQFLFYDERECSFKKQPLPLSYDKKLQQLQNMQFNNQKIQAFKDQFIQIIQKYQGHPYSTRYYLLAEIEKAAATADERSQTFLQKLCYQLYTEFDGMSYGQAVINRFLSPIALSFSHLPQILESDRQGITKLADDIVGTGLRNKKERVQGAAGIAFHPMTTNNFACKLWTETYEEGTSVKIIRFGSPTTQKVNRSSVLEQMKLFLEECKQRQETVLSFQHQTFRGEKPRLQSMMDLAAEEEFRDTLYCINMDMDSAFYHQSGKYEKQISYTDFKKNLVAHVVNFKKSKNLETKINGIENYQQDLEMMADQVLAAYFSDKDKDKLTRQERQDFIFLYYLRYRQYLHAKLTPTYSCSQCKDTMDRSMSIFAGAFLMQMMDLKLHENLLYLQAFRILSDFVGIIVKGSPMHQGRYDRFLPVVQRLTALTKLPEIIPYITSQQIPEMHHPHLRPYPCEEQTFETYLASDLMKPTSTIPLDSTVSPTQIIQDLYRNDRLKCRVKVDDTTFRVFADDKPLATGLFTASDSILTIEIEKRTSV